VDEVVNDYVDKPSFETGFNESVESTADIKQDDSDNAVIVADKPEPEGDVKADVVVKVEEPVSKQEPDKVIAEKESADFDSLQQDLNTAYESLTADIADKYERGELTYKDAQVQQAQLNTRYQAEAGKLTAQSATAQQAQAKTESDWQSTQDAFFADNADFKDPIIHGALAAALTELYKDPANASKTQGALFQEAIAQVSSKLGMSVASSEKADDLTKKRQGRLAGNVSVKSSGNTVQQKAKGFDAGFNAKD
jgi:hypothetical protein